MGSESEIRTRWISFKINFSTSKKFLSNIHPVVSQEVSNAIHVPLLSVQIHPFLAMETVVQMPWKHPLLFVQPTQTLHVSQLGIGRILLLVTKFQSLRKIIAAVRRFISTISTITTVIAIHPSLETPLKAIVNILAARGRSVIKVHWLSDDSVTHVMPPLMLAALLLAPPTTIVGMTPDQHQF